MRKIQFARFFSLLLTLVLLMQCFAAPALADLSLGKFDNNDPHSVTNPDKELNPDGWDGWDGCTHPESRRISEHMVPASCETDGYYEYTCDCGFHERITIHALGHAMMIDSAVEPTCTEAGSSEGRYCSICGLTMVDKKPLPAKGHTIVIDSAVAASCTKTGLTEGSHCSVCGKVLVKQDAIPAIDHTVVIDHAVAASCDSCGLTEGSHCSVCGKVLLAQKEIPAAGHTILTDAAVAATCESSGLTEGSHCSTCKKVLVAQKEIPAAGHTILTDAAVAATCESSGLTEGSHCSTCKKVLVAQKEIPAAGHTIVADAAVESTCTKAGLSEGKHCSVCSKVLIEQQTLPLAAHAYALESDPAQGKGKFICVNCSYTVEFEGNSIDQLFMDGYISAYDYVTTRPMTDAERLDLSVCLYAAGKLTAAEYSELTNGFVDTNIQKFYVSDYLDPNAADHSTDSLSGNELGEDSNIDYIISASQSTSDGGSKQSLDIQYKSNSTATKSTIHMNDSQLTMEAKEGQSLPSRSQVFTVESSDGSITTLDLYENGKTVGFEDAHTITHEDGSSETILISDSGTKYTYSKDSTRPLAKDSGKDYSGTDTNPVTSTATQAPTASPSPSPTPTSPVIADAGSKLEYGQEAAASPSPSVPPASPKKTTANNGMKGAYSIEMTQNISAQEQEAAEGSGISSAKNQNGSSNIVAELNLGNDNNTNSENDHATDSGPSIIDHSPINGGKHLNDLIGDAELQKLLSSFRSSGNSEQAHQLQQELNEELDNEGDGQSYTIIGSGDNAYAISNKSSDIRNDSIDIGSKQAHQLQQELNEELDNEGDGQSYTIIGSGDNAYAISNKSSDIRNDSIDIGNNKVSSGNSGISFDNNDFNINSNSASSGGATYSSSEGSDSDIGNNSESSGGSIYGRSDIHIDKNDINFNINSNSASSGGATYSSSEGSDSDIGNNSESSGGSIYGRSDIHIDKNDINFNINSNSASSGGATYSSSEGSGSDMQSGVENTAVATASPTPAPEATPAPSPASTGNSNAAMEDIMTENYWEKFNGGIDSRITDDLTMTRSMMIDLLMQNGPASSSKNDPAGMDDNYGEREFIGQIDSVFEYSTFETDNIKNFIPNPQTTSRADLLELLREKKQNAQGGSGSIDSSKSRSEVADDSLASMQSNGMQQGSQQPAQSSQGGILIIEENNDETIFLLSHKKPQASLWNTAN